MPSSRRTRLLALVGAVTTLALVALPAQAGTSGARLSDPVGDIAVPSLDIISGEIRLDSTRSARTLTMTATMAGDLLGLPADYDLVTGSRQGRTCFVLATRVRWNGVSLQQSYQYNSTFTCKTEVTTSMLAVFASEAAHYAIGGDPVNATAGGRTVSVTLPAPAWLRPGTLAGFGLITHTPAEGVRTYAGTTEVGNYDTAGIEHDWRAS